MVFYYNQILCFVIEKTFQLLTSWDCKLASFQPPCSFPHFVVFPTGIQHEKLCFYNLSKTNSALLTDQCYPFPASVYMEGLVLGGLWLCHAPSLFG